MNPLTRDELEALLTALLEGVLTPEEQARLEQLLREDFACRRFYLAHLDQHARLLSSPALATGKLAPASGQRPPQPELPARFSAKRFWRDAVISPLGIAAILIALLAGAALWRWTAWPRQVASAGVRADEQTGAGCAVLAQTHEAVFAGSSPPLTGAMLVPGALRLQNGLARIEFFSGATVLLEGQTELRIISAWEAECPLGSARVRVPPPARGFKLHAPGLKLVDLGTEFGLKVDGGGKAHVTVFEGEVEAFPDTGGATLLRGGDSARVSEDQGLAAVAAAPAFASIQDFDALRARHAQERHDAWWLWFQENRRDPRLVACYAFKHWRDDRWVRLVNNFAEPRNPTRSGAAVGSRWTQGRWPMKDALEFKGPGDRVRINLGHETYQAITLACWVRVDALDRRYNGLLLTDGYEPGEPHWQIYEDGRLMFSIAYPDPSAPGDQPKKRNQIYYSPPIFSLSNQRRWRHIAVTYDSASGAAAQYLDGAEISREIHEFHQPGRPITFGPCEIGNWGLPTDGHQFPIRNLNGCMDEMLIYKAALNGAEIQEIHNAGRPE